MKLIISRPFDLESGLRFQIKHLNYISRKSEVIGVWITSRQMQAEFADLIAVEKTLQGKEIIIPTLKEMTEANVTAIGNLAYFALHSPHTALKDKAENLLQLLCLQGIAEFGNRDEFFLTPKI